MASATVHVRGLNETLRALNKVNKAASKTVKTELAKAALPVAATAREKVSRYAGASVGTIGPRVSTKGAFVTQRAKKVTGLRGDFGTLQQQHLETALDEHENEIVRDVEQAFDRLTISAGF